MVLAKVDAVTAYLNTLVTDLDSAACAAETKLNFTSGGTTISIVSVAIIALILAHIETITAYLGAGVRVTLVATLANPTSLNVAVRVAAVPINVVAVVTVAKEVSHDHYSITADILASVRLVAVAAPT